MCLWVTMMIMDTAISQNMNTPYSAYGIGDIDHRAYNRTSGMGGTGLALSSSFYMIDNNPASIAGLTRSFYIVDFSAAAKSAHYKGDPITGDNSNGHDFWIKRFGISVKINKVWASGFGIQQFSDVNYKFQGTKAVEGSTATYPTEYEGDGGLNEYYWTNAFSLGKHLSFGIKSSFIAGGVNQTETISDATLQSVISTQVQNYYTHFRFQGGALYSAQLNKRWGLSLGARFDPKTKLVSDKTLTVMQDATALVTNEFLSNDHFYLPNTLATGIALKHDNKTTFALDYTYEDWSSLQVKGQGWQLISSQKLSAGVEFSKQKLMVKQLYEKRYFQFGGFVRNSYLQINNRPINEYGITGGMGGAFNNSLLYNIALEAGSRGTLQAGLIKENYVQFTFGLSFRDFLFSKGHKYN